MATERERLLAWEGCLNARDLGGYPTADGRETRWGAVLRSDEHSRLSEAGRAALVASGVRTVIDLRMPEELRTYPSPWAEAGEHGIAYENISFVDPAIPGPDAPLALADDYVGMLGKFAPRVGQVVTAVARAPEGGVLVHCAAGKDRTGLICALLLDVAGVDRETIGADYALTEENLRPRQEEWLERGPGERADRERDLARGRPLASVMEEVLGRVQERYGGAEAYLVGPSGVAPEDIERVRARLVADGGGEG